jgi:large subunit ribosomal protein L39e
MLIMVSDDICNGNCLMLTLKNRLYCNEVIMAARKNTSRKIRLLRKVKQNRPVPAWVIIRTHRHVRTNPKRRSWRRSDVNVG